MKNTAYIQDDACCVGHTVWPRHQN